MRIKINITKKKPDTTKPAQTDPVVTTDDNNTEIQNKNCPAKRFGRKTVNIGNLNYDLVPSWVKVSETLQIFTIECVLDGKTDNVFDFEIDPTTRFVRNFCRKNRSVKCGKDEEDKEPTSMTNEQGDCACQADKIVKDIENNSKNPLQINAKCHEDRFKILNYFEFHRPF